MDGSIRRESSSIDGGFGLLEVVIAMFLFAIIAMAALPAFATAQRASAQNATIATASQLASRDIESARAAAVTCTGLRTYATASATTTTDPRGLSYSVARSPITCPAAFPAVIPYTTTVSVGTATYATVSTKILVTS